MKIALQTRNVQSSLQSWLDNELEVRGIDAVIYTRYILSLLQQEIFYDYEEEEAVLNKLFEYRKSKQKSGRRRRGPSPSFGRHGMDPEKVKKLAAIECLLSASDEDCDVEGLVEELYKKLQESQQQQSEICRTAQRCSCVPACNSQSTSDNNTPQVLAEKYYAAFPALRGSSEPQSSPGSQSDSSVTVVSVWHKRKLQLNKKGSGQENGQSKRKGFHNSIKRRRPIHDITNKMPHFVSRAQSVPHEEPELLIKKGKMAHSWPEKSSYVQPHRSNTSKRHSHFKTVNNFARRNDASQIASKIHNRIKLVDEEQLVEYTKEAMNVPSTRGSPEIEHFLSKTAGQNPKNGVEKVVTEDEAWYTSPIHTMLDSGAGNVKRLYNRVQNGAIACGSCSDNRVDKESNPRASARRLYERGNTTQADFSIHDGIVDLGDQRNQAHLSGIQLQIIGKEFDTGKNICSNLQVDETKKSFVDESAAVDSKGLDLHEMRQALLCLQEEDLTEGISEMMQDSSGILNKSTLSPACIWSPSPSHSVAHSFLSNLPELDALNVEWNFGDFNFNFLQDFNSDSALNDIIEDHLLLSPNSIFLDCEKIFSHRALSPTFRQPCIGTNPKVNLFDKTVGSKKATACDLGVFSIRTHESEEEHFDFGNLDLHGLRPSSIQHVYETLSQASNDFKLWDIDLQLPSDELWLHFQSKSPRVLEFFLDCDDHFGDVHKSYDEFTVVKRERSLSLDSADLYGSPGKWSDTFNNRTASGDLSGSEKQSFSLQKNSVFHSEPIISLAGTSFFNHSYSESGFVEVRTLPKSVKATLLKHEVKSVPTKHATNLQDDEDLLTSPKTHFRPIRPDDLTIDCTTGAEGLEDLEDQYWIPEVSVMSRPFPAGCKLLGEEFHTYRVPVEELTTEETFAPKFKKVHPDKYSQTDLDAEHAYPRQEHDVEVSSLLSGTNKFDLQSTESKESISNKDHISGKATPEGMPGLFNSSSFLFGLLPCSVLSSEENSRSPSRNVSDFDNTSKLPENINVDALDISRDIFYTASHKWTDFEKSADRNENIWSSVPSSLANKISNSNSGTLHIPIKIENRTEYKELEEKSTLSADDGIDDILETVTKDRWSQHVVFEKDLFPSSDAKAANKSNFANSDISLGHMKDFFVNETTDESNRLWLSPVEDQHIVDDGCKKASIWSIGDEVIQLSTDNSDFDKITEEGEHVLFGYGTDYGPQERGRGEYRKLQQSGIWDYCQASESTISVDSKSKSNLRNPNPGETLERQWSLQEVEWKDSGELGGSESLMTRFGKWDPTFAVTGSVGSSFKNTWLSEQRMLFDDKSSDGWLDTNVDLVETSKSSLWTKQSNCCVGQSIYRKEGVWMEKSLAFKGGTAGSNIYVTGADDDIFKIDHQPAKCEDEMRYSPKNEEFCVGSVEQMKRELKQEQMQLMHDIDSLRNDELKHKTADGPLVGVGGKGSFNVLLTTKDDVGVVSFARKKKGYVQSAYDDEDEENLSWESQEDMEGEELLGSLEAVLHIPKDKLIFSTDLEEEWKSNSKSFEVQVPRHRQQRTSKDLSKRPCSFFLEGSCRRADCKFSHNISRITCRFWEEGSCFKGITCPFLHGYVGDDEHRHSGSGTPSCINTEGAVFELEMDSKCDKGSSSSSSSTPQEAEAADRSDELRQKSEQLKLKANAERKKLGRFSMSRYKSSKSHSKSAPIDIQSIK